MSILLFPFKILGVPCKLILGFVGVIIAAAINAMIIRQLTCWAAWNFGWSSITMTTLNIITFCAFVATFAAANEK